MSTKSTPGRRARMASTGRFVKPGDPMTQERLDEIEAALNDATPGPWSAETCGHLITHVNDADGIPIGICQECTNDATYEAPNAELIAHAPEYIAYLLAEVERLRALTTVDAALGTGEEA